jgi:NodT family efflux transporter outer membrane factor (OMF) lipoprotein
MFFMITLLVTGYGCKTRHETVPVQIAMPSQYDGSQDTANSAVVNWRTYFNDPMLAALIDEGLKNNQDLLAVLKKMEVSQSYVTGARGALFPSVNANAAFLQRKFGLYTMDGAGNISTTITPGQIVPIHLPDFYLGLQTSWEADIWGKLRSKKQAALSRYLSSVEGRNLVVTNLVSDIAASYYELLKLDNELDIIFETISLQQNALALMGFQKQAGITNELAVKQFKAQVLNSTALKFETLQRITECENRINFLLGRYPQAIERKKERFYEPFAFKPESGIPSELLSNRPDIRKAEFELLASKADVRAARAAFYPSFTITGSLGFQSFNTAFLFRTPESLAYSLLNNLVAPLINRSAIKSEFNPANARQQEALYNYQKTILNGYVEVYNEMAKIKNLDSIAGLKTEEMQVLKESVETSGELFRTGRASYVEVLMAQKNSIQSSLEWLEVKRRQYHAFINIYKCLGGGWK